jgi:copper chaperone
LEEMSLTVPGMWADHHVLKVREVLCAIEGVVDVEAAAFPRTVTIRFDPARTNAAALTHELERAGYAASDIVELDEHPRNKPEWASNGSRVTVTNKIDLAMSGDHRKY